MDAALGFYMAKLRYTNLSLTIGHLLDQYAVNTPSYKLAKFLVPILSPLTANEYTVKDSFAFAKEITKTDFNYVMASLDVESLVTNMPLEETIENCVNDLFFDKSKIDNLTKQDLYDLLSAAAKEWLFIFDSSLYRQIDRVAMGSPLSSTLANSFLCHYENEWLDSCPIEFKPKLYQRYVCDIFVTFWSRDHVKKLVDYMNTEHPNTRFTFEIEHQNSFSFLNIKFIRNTEKKAFETSVHRRSTCSGVFTNFESFVLSTYKTGLLETMLFRCSPICSSYEKIHKEIVKLKEIFKRNSYP